MLMKTILLVLKILLWLAIVAGVLITIVFAAVSIGETGGQRIFDWIVTALIGGFTSSLLYVALRVVSGPAGAPRRARSGGNLIRVSLTAALSGLPFIGLVLTLYSFDKHGFSAGALLLATTVVIPCLVIRLLLGRDRIQTDDPEPPQGVNNSPATQQFGRSGNSTVIPILLIGTIIVFSPLSLGALTMPLWAGLSLISVSISAFGMLLVYGDGFLLLHQYALIRDRHQPLIVIDDIGVHSWGIKKNSLTWSEITSVRLRYSNGFSMLLLGMKHPEKYYGQINRFFSSTLRVPVHIVKGDEREVLRAIREHPYYSGT